MTARWFALGMAGLAGTILFAGWWWSRLPAPPAQAEAFFVPEATDAPVTPIPRALNLDARKVALGARLFQDRRLSADDSTACVDCHRLDAAGQDSRAVAIGLRAQRGTMYSPTVFNSGFNFRQFWDGRAATLEEQAAGPVHNPIEMGSNWPQVLAKLAQDEALMKEFRVIWGQGPSGERIQEAIAVFERSLTTPDAAFDRYLRGDAQALGEEALAGWRLFHDLGCSACHQGVNLGGNLYANLGVMGDYFAERGRPVQKSDLGRYNVTGLVTDRHVFKVPTLRNVARTAPYFHDGSIERLDEAVRTMARYQLGLQLADAEVRRLTAFLESLTGRHAGQPL